MLSLLALLAVQLGGAERSYHRWQVYRECDLPGRVTAPDCTWSMVQSGPDFEVRLEKSAENVVFRAGFTALAREPARMFEARIDSNTWQDATTDEQALIIASFISSWVAQTVRGHCKGECPNKTLLLEGLKSALGQFTIGKAN